MADTIRPKAGRHKGELILFRPVGQAAEESGAGVDLIQFDELVGPVGLAGVARAADDGGDAGFLEQAGPLNVAFCLYPRAREVPLAPRAV